MHRLQELVRLYRLQTSSRERARLLSMSRNTERDYRRLLDGAGVLAGDANALPSEEELRQIVGAPTTAPAQASSIEAWADVVTTLVDRGARPQAIYDHLRRTDEAFTGSLSAVKRLVTRIRKVRGPSEDDVAIPVDTAPGEVAQVDFGYVGKLFDPEEGYLRKAYVFVMVLGYSRHMFAALVFDQKVETWLQLHMAAFAYLGGVPKVVVPDNLKAAVIRAAFGVDDETVLNKSYIELARHYGFMVDPTPPYAPKKKGKVERAVQYVKNNFFSTCSEEDGDLVRRSLFDWLEKVAALRTHGTTRRCPIDMFAEEHPHLLPLPSRAYEVVIHRRAKVHRDTLIQLDRALYSVPWQLVGKEVDVRMTTKSIIVHYQDQRVAVHQKVPAGTRAVLEEHLPESRRHLRRRSREEWEDRAAAIGPDVHDWVQEVFDSDDVLSKLRLVQNAVRLLEDHPKDRANKACRRANFFGNYTYGGLKDILKKALDFKPLPEVLVADETFGTLKNPRFKRDIRELMQLPLEITDEPH